MKSFKRFAIEFVLHGVCMLIGIVAIYQTILRGSIWPIAFAGAILLAIELVWLQWRLKRMGREDGVG